MMFANHSMTQSYPNPNSHLSLVDQNHLGDQNQVVDQPPRKPALPLGLSTNLITNHRQETLNIEKIALPTSQPRRYFEPKALQSLAESISKYGILEPLLVRPLPGTATGSEADLADSYELVAGERRYRAALLTGLRSVPTIIRPLSDQEALLISLVENLQREDLNPIEETEGMLQLLMVELQRPREAVLSLLYRLRNEAKGKVSHTVTGSLEGETVRSIFQSVGSMTWESFVSNRLPLLKLPESILAALRQGQLAYTKAIAIAKVRQPDQRDQLLQTAIENELSLSEIRLQVVRLNTSSTELPTLSLQQRWSHAYRRLQKSGALTDPQKRQQIEALIDQLVAIADLEDKPRIPQQFS